MNQRTQNGVRVVWQGHTSALTLTPWILAAVFGFWLVVPLAIAVWKLIVLRCHLYRLTEEELIEKSGVFNINYDHMELFRIQDVTYQQQWWQRLFDLGDVTMITTDPTNPELVLRSVSDPDGIVAKIREFTNEARQDNRHFEINVNNSRFPA